MNVPVTTNIVLGRCARHLLPVIVLMIFTILVSCDWKKKEYIRPPRLPYPGEEMAKYLQTQVDSSRFLWFTDVKATASAFCNEEVFTDKPVSTGDIVIIGERLFHATVEVHLNDRILVLTMQRPFMHKDINSIWQVTKLEEKNGKAPSQSK